MPGDVGFPVEILCIEHVDGAEDAGHGVLRGRHAHDVDVVGHEAIGPDVEAVAARVPFQEFQVMLIIRRPGKNGLPIISPLGDVMRVTYRYSTRYPRHNRLVRHPPSPGIGTEPLFHF
jgi:hypothetical protein